MNDHEMDDQMRRLAHSYNEPPVPPRDEMWAQIERARARPSIVTGTGRRMYWFRMGAGIAAVLVVGIGIGRLSRQSGPAASSSLAATYTPTGSIAALAGNGNQQVSTASQPAATLTAAESATSANRVRATRADRLDALQAARTASTSGATAYGVPRGVQGTVGDGSEMSANRLAVIEHMAHAEVLLTSFLAESRTSPSDARTAAQFALLSRDLLKTTRLLLATRTSDDPALTRLLEDLELVLMQISQYSSEGRRGDLDAINQSLDRRSVLPKLRSAIPAGASASTGI